jgi:hypothetical protein
MFRLKFIRTQVASKVLGSLQGLDYEEFGGLLNQHPWDHKRGMDHLGVGIGSLLYLAHEADVRYSYTN